MNTKSLTFLVTGATAAMVLGIALNGVGIAIFGIAAVAMVALIGATDYAPRRCYHRVMCAGGHEPLPFAA